MTRARVAIVGLDGVGKSSILMSLQGRRVLSGATTPTNGCNQMCLYRLDSGTWTTRNPTDQCHFALEVLDLGGSDSMRPYWKKVCEGVDALIAVVDVTETNPQRWDELTNELKNLRIDLEDVHGVMPILSLLNRKGQSLGECTPPKDALARLGLDGQLGVHALMISSSRDAAALRAGLDWLWTIFGPDPDDVPAVGDTPDAMQEAAPSEEASARSGSSVDFRGKEDSAKAEQPSAVDAEEFVQSEEVDSDRVDYPPEALVMSAGPIGLIRSLRRHRENSHSSECSPAVSPSGRRGGKMRVARECSEVRALEQADGSFRGFQ
ncbi:hypothetical protein AB1Y20_009864 [Prymnesium parvum]|uniref:Uncharacterized protein n=1 Tax=Prymnesium parvum TaxID=97485 RepID=A0AB34K698_PRYPA